MQRKSMPSGGLGSVSQPSSQTQADASAVPSSSVVPLMSIARQSLQKSALVRRSAGSSAYEPREHGLAWPVLHCDGLGGPPGLRYSCDLLALRGKLLAGNTLWICHTDLGSSSTLAAVFSTTAQTPTKIDDEPSRLGEDSCGAVPVG